MRVRRSSGPYRIEEVLGEGGCGRVFRATNPTGGCVALKVLERRSPGFDEFLSLLRREESCVRRIPHPGVVRVLSLEEDEREARLVMELMEGGTLHDRIVSSPCRAPRLPEQMVLRTALRILKALHAAEVAGIVHGDLKPANILYTAAGVAKLGDFGLAHGVGEGDSPPSQLPATPDYVAPEVLLGEDGDFRSDLYGLGGCLYHALSGHPPFRTGGLPVSELVRVKSRAPRLSRSLCSLETSRAVFRMMNPDPSGRPSSHAELEEDLLGALAGLVARRRFSRGPLARWFGWRAK
jgi:serine/threonine protein kinase